ncbi:MAG TPA: hypothetical protein VKH43_04755 [Thermoanaerobaculia bacterium]|nr:hypothetical protein [Thermoanaerobaculia bacterium]
MTDPSMGTVFLWKAAGLTPIGTVPYSFQGGNPYGGCSDGISFWITPTNGYLAQF